VSRDYPDKAPGGLAASLFDQAILSAATFGVAAVFVAIASKTEFAVYSLVWASIQLASSIQNALILTPFLANIAYLRESGREHFLGVMGRLELFSSIVAGSIAALATWVSTAACGRADAGLAVSAGIALAGTWAREYRRTRQFADLQPARVLVGDTAYSLLLALLIVVGFYSQRTLTAAWALGSWGIAGLSTGIDGHIRFRMRMTAGSPWKSSLAGQVRWTLPSVILSWVQGNAYNFAALAITGIHSVADINTARLFSSPLSLLQGGWNRVFLPSAAARMAEGNRKEAVRHGMLGVTVLAAVTLIYSGGLLAAISIWHPTRAHLQAPGLTLLIVTWLVYQFASGARGIGTSLMVVQSSFAQLFWLGLVAAVATIALMLLAGSLWGASGLLIAMIGGEAILGGLIWGRVFDSSEEDQHKTRLRTLSSEPLRAGEQIEW
jgi:hypothetical protein